MVRVRAFQKTSSKNKCIAAQEEYFGDDNNPSISKCLNNINFGNFIFGPRTLFQSELNPFFYQRMCYNNRIAYGGLSHFLDLN